MGGKNEESNKALCQTTSENPRCHLHIPQLKKNIYVLNIIVQKIMEKKEMKENNPKETPKTIMPLVGVQKLDESKNQAS